MDSERPAEAGRCGTAVVLAGGGARGAYEAGALSVLLPALATEGRRPTIWIGTSAGAINAAAFASLAHLDPAVAGATALELWREVGARSVYRSPLTAGLSAAVSRRPTRAAGLLDTSPLLATLGRLIDWAQLHDNVDAGHVDAVGLVANAWATRRSTVFLEHGVATECPPSDAKRSIDYVSTRLVPQHVLGSAAIPVLFPPVAIAVPASAADWYIDGGVRLNTPIKPALTLAAERVVVVATAPGLEPLPNAGDRPGPPPGLAGGAAQLLTITLDDRMLEDLRTLAGRNEQATPDAQPGDDKIPWLFVGPPVDDAGLFAHLVDKVLSGEAATGRVRRGPFRRLARRGFGRLLARDPSRFELLSHLCFDPDFIDGAIRLGQRDGRRAVDAIGVPHWQEGRPV